MIKTLQLENFKCFSKQTFELSNLNLLTGLNGMGKSSVIQSLLLLRQNYENGLLHLRKQLGLNGEYTQSGTSLDLLYRYFNTKEIGISLNYEDKSSLNLKWDASVNSDIINGISEIENFDFEKYSLFNNQFHYLNAERVGPRQYYETSTYKVRHQNQLGVRGEYAANFFGVNQDMEIPNKSLIFDNQTGNTLYEQVNAWLSLIRPGTKVVVKDQPDSGTVSLHFEFVQGKDNPGSYKAYNVGFGLTYVFPLIVAILVSKPGTLLLLENPEAHVHPKGQAELGILLAKAAASGIQIIVETHSDHILNGVRFAVKEKLIDHSLTRLMFFTGSIIEERFNHHVDYVKINELGKLSHRPDDFFDVWERMLTKLI
jgi:predicted ATPase